MEHMSLLVESLSKKLSRSSCLNMYYWYPNHVMQLNIYTPVPGIISYLIFPGTRCKYSIELHGRGTHIKYSSWLKTENLGHSFRLDNGSFGLFAPANTHISICSVWAIPIFQSGWSGQYLYFGLFVLANIHISVGSLWPIPIFVCAYYLHP